MVALLVALGVMAVMMTAAMPVWKQITQREKEAELIFRGQQYARAIGLFQRKAGPGSLPPSVDVLVQQRFLRSKYKDPITGQDFDLLSPVQAAQAGAAPGAQPSPASGRGNLGPAAAGGVGSVLSTQTAGGRGAQGGIIGVASKSKARSIRLYNGRSHYNEWQFIYVQQVQAPGAPGAGGQPQRGGQQPPTGIPGIGGRGGRGQQGPPGRPGGLGGGADGRGPFTPGQPLPGGGGPSSPQPPPRPPRN